jgi:ubiquinone/menaquinone biosynthesis C-methylase UbiE
MANLENSTSEARSLQKQELEYWENMMKNGEEIDLRYARDLPDHTPKFILRTLTHFEDEVAEFSFEGCSGLVLDAGCGNGNLLRRAMSPSSGKQHLNDKIRYVGLDFSRNMLGMAASRSLNASFAQGCINHLPFKDRTFDRVVSSGVITCLPSIQDEVHSLKEFHRVLKPGGVLVVDFFNQQSHFTRVRKTLFKEAINPPEYISPSSFQSQLEDAGFRVLTLRGFDYKPYQGYLFMSRWRSLVDPCFVQERFSRFVEARVVPKIPGISRFGYRIYVKCQK